MCASAEAPPPVEAGRKGAERGGGGASTNDYVHPLYLHIFLVCTDCTTSTYGFPSPQRPPVRHSHVSSFGREENRLFPPWLKEREANNTPTRAYWRNRSARMESRSPRRCVPFIHFKSVSCLNGARRFQKMCFYGSVSFEWTQRPARRPRTDGVTLGESARRLVAVCDISSRA